ncbi:MAG TPA: ATP-binding protein [Anaerolineales bacterium]
MDEPAILRLNANLSDLEDIRNFVEKYAQRLNVDPSATYDILLSVTEMVTNTIVHGYRGESGPIEIEISQQDEALVVFLRDEAPPFDPTQLPTPDITLPLEQRPVGGLGVYLTREFMDRMSYRQGPRGGNEIVLVKEGIIPR